MDLATVHIVPYSSLLTVTGLENRLFGCLLHSLSLFHLFFEADVTKNDVATRQEKQKVKYLLQYSFHIKQRLSSACQLIKSRDYPSKMWTETADR